MIGSKDPFVQVMRTTNFSSRVDDYADKVRISYDKMTLPKIGSRLEELTSTVQSQIKINATIKTLDDNKVYDNLSNKLKELCDLLDTKYSTREFKDEVSQIPPSLPQTADTKKEDPPITTDV